MTLRQEVGAVMMVGFTGPLAPAILDDWRQRQFGGLILLTAEKQAGDPAGIPAMIESLRGVMAHPLLAATDGIGGDMTVVAERLKAQGFDLDLELNAEAPSGQLAPAAAKEVSAVVAALHAAGMYAAISGSGPVLEARDLTALRAAIAAHIDMVMVRDLSVPVLRRQLGFQGVVISTDLSPPGAEAAVGFLENGGDMVLISEGVSTADAVYDAIHLAVLSGRYRRSQLDASVQKLLNLGLRFMP